MTEWTRVALGVGIALAVAVLTMLTTPWLLRHQPAPVSDPEDEPDPLGDPGPVDFAELDTPGFGRQVFIVSALAGVVLLVSTPVTLWPIWAPLAGVGALLGLIDLRTTYLPIRLNYLALGLAAVGAVASAWWRGDWGTLAWAAGGCLAGLIAFWLVWFLSRGQLGFGDVRLAAVIGLAAGATSSTALAWSFLLGTLAGAVWGIIVRVRGSRVFAYGPGLLLGPPLALALAALVGAG